MVLQFSKYGKSLGSRVLGSEIRSKVEESLRSKKQVTFDFKGVGVVSNSFADECFAKILLKFNINEIQKNTKFINVNEFVGAVISSALQQRLRPPST